MVIFFFYKLVTNLEYDSKSLILKLSFLFFYKLLESKTIFISMVFFIQKASLRYNPHMTTYSQLKFATEWIPVHSQFFVSTTAI